MPRWTRTRPPGSRAPMSRSTSENSSRTSWTSSRRCARNVAVKDTEFLHAPLWFATYTYQNQRFTIVLDGASGEVVRGDIPPPTGGFGEFLRQAGRGLFNE